MIPNTLRQWCCLAVVATCIGPSYANAKQATQAAPIGAVEQIETPPPLDRYRGRSVLIGASAIAWFAGLLAIAWIRRGRAVLSPDAVAPEKPEVRLAILARRGLAGELTVAEAVELERLLLDRWSGSADGPETQDSRAAIARSQDGEQRLAELEQWLYRRESSADARRRVLEPLAELKAAAELSRRAEAMP